MQVQKTFHEMRFHELVRRLRELEKYVEDTGKRPLVPACDIPAIAEFDELEYLERIIKLRQENKDFF